MVKVCPEFLLLSTASVEPRPRVLHVNADVGKRLSTRSLQQPYFLNF